KREIPADDGADLSDLLANWKGVETSHEGGLQRGRNRVGRKRLERREMAVPLPWKTSFQDCSRQFLNIQRHPICVRNDSIDDFLRDRPPANDFLDEGSCVSTVECVQKLNCHLRAASPKRLRHGTRGNNKQYWQTLSRFNQRVQQFEGRRVRPVDVFQY